MRLKKQSIRHGRCNVRSRHTESSLASWAPEGSNFVPKSEATSTSQEPTRAISFTNGTCSKHKIKNPLAQFSSKLNSLKDCGSRLSKFAVLRVPLKKQVRVRFLGSGCDLPYINIHTCSHIHKQSEADSILSALPQIAPAGLRSPRSLSALVYLY